MFDIAFLGGPGSGRKPNGRSQESSDNDTTRARKAESGRKGGSKSSRREENPKNTNDEQ